MSNQSDSESVTDDPHHSQYLSRGQQYVLYRMLLILLGILGAMLVVGFTVATVNHNETGVDKREAETEACTQLDNDVDQRDCMERVLD